MEKKRFELQNKTGQDEKKGAEKLDSSEGMVSLENLKKKSDDWIDKNVDSAWSADDFSDAVDSAKKELSGWGAGGRNLGENPITDEEIQSVCLLITRQRNGSLRDLRDLVSQM